MLLGNFGLAFICAVGLFFFSTQLFGDVVYISGTVTTVQDKPVKNALVQFTETADTSAKFTILTDSLGYYAIVFTCIEKQNEPIRSFKLHQNYPNPFTEVTTIGYKLQKSEPVNITIYDLLGRKVKTLVSKKQPPGIYSTFWDGTNQSG